LTLKNKVRSYWNKYPCGTKNIGSPGTKFFTKNDIIKLFSMFKKLKIQTIVILYDLRITKRKYLTFLKYLIPSSLGFFMIKRGEKKL
jgi:hypothetical protein